MFISKEEKKSILRDIDDLFKRVGRLEVDGVYRAMAKAEIKSSYGMKKDGTPRAKPGRKPKAVVVKKEEKK